MKLIFSLVLILFFGHPDAIAQTGPKSGTDGKRDTIHFKLTDHHNIAIVGTLNEVDTVTLMFHTAATDLALTKEYTAVASSLNWTDGGEVQSWGGASKALMSLNNTLGIGTMRWDSLSIWEDERSGPGTDGKFGPDLFAGKVLEINYANRMLVIHEKLPEGLDGHVKLPLESDRGMLFLSATSQVAGQTYLGKFLVHSGYGGAVLFNDDFVAETQLGDRIEITEVQELRDSYGNVLETKKGVLSGFELGGVVLDSLTVGFFEGAIGRQKLNVIGGDLLRRFNWVFTEDRKFVYLSKT